MPGQGGGSHGVGAGEKDFALFAAHASGKIAVGGADAVHRFIQSPKSIERTTETGGAGGVLGHEHASVGKNLPDGGAVPMNGLQFFDHAGSGGHAEGIDLDAFALDDFGEGEEIACFAPGAGADVGAVECDFAEVFGEFTLTWIGVHGDGGFELGEIENFVVNEFLVTIQKDGIVIRLGAVGFDAGVHVVESGLVGRKDAVFCPCLDGHVGDGHAIIHMHGIGSGTFPLHGAIGGAIETDITDDMQDHVLGHHAVSELAFEIKTHGFGDFDEKFADAEDETGVGVADAGGKFPKSACHAGVRIGAKKNFTRAGMPFGG